MIDLRATVDGLETERDYYFQKLREIEILTQTLETQSDNHIPTYDLIKEIQPDIVVNTAAVPSVDLCETNHEIADKLHVNATQDITKICQDINSKLIYISTDAVFQGELNKKIY